MNKQLKYIFIGILICLQACSLEDNSRSFEEFVEADPLELMNGAMTQMAFNHSALPARTWGGFMQYMEPGDSRIGFFNYNIPSEYFDSMWRLGYYGGSLASANEMKRLAEEAGNNMAVAISMVLLANEYGNLTYAFGDIPFSEALLGNENLTPSYDPQEDVCQGIIQMLDDAIALIGSNGLDGSLAAADLIYNGDMQLWSKFANGLKARLLLNQRNQISGMESEILSLIDQSFVMRSEQAEFPHSEDRPNPLFTFGEERPSTYFNTEYFVDILMTSEDPRFVSYTIADFPEWEYFGEPQLVWSRVDTPMPILSYTELLFTKAEALFHTGASTEVLETALREAIISSLVDNELEINTDVEDYISAASALTDLSSDEVLQKIVEQAYVSYYGYNFLQAWNNYRRTGYPELEDPGFTPGDNNPSNVVPRRLRYPQEEKDFNATNVEDAIERQNGDLLDDDVWMFR